MGMTCYLNELAAEIQAEIDPALVPRGDTASLWRMYAVLVRAKGVDVQAAEVHDAWTAWALTEKPNHQALLPFEQLDPDTQAKDEPYVLALRRVAARRRSAARTITS